ncbi:MAG: FtsW/RodA/SpoVE family cell cycle protein, partial [Pseudomonadota bacterium]
KNLFLPVVLIALPALLVVRQPDLGTALLLSFGGIVLIFLSGARMSLFVGAIAIALVAIPVGWGALHDYQQDRVLTFLDPERDPQGTGYHIRQSKIALGSGGLTGKGYLQGTQSHLNFLPEMHTDFIFTMFAEEFGLFGSLFLLGLYAALIVFGNFTASQSRSHFGRLVASGATTVVFLYVFINIAMVMGLLPVVGVPLPLVSFGGSATLTVMFALGLIMNVAVHSKVRLDR